MRGTRTTVEISRFLGLLAAVLALNPATTATAQICGCECDVDGNGSCQAQDLGRVIDCVNGVAGAPFCDAADINCDAVVDDSDLLAVICLIQDGGFGVLDCCQPRFGAAFTYQGDITVAGVPYTGDCDFEFTLWDDPAAGMTVGPTLTMTTVPVTDGLFSVPLSFGLNAFDGFQRWIEVAMVCPSGGGAMTTLSPRQELLPVPYAVRAGTGVGGLSALNVSPAGDVGIGTLDPASKLHVEGDLQVDAITASNINLTAGLVAQSTAQPAILNRTGSDGILIEFKQDFATEGSITVAGAVVSYNAFTGSHFAWSNDPLFRGALVTLTGANKTFHDRPGAELLYGIALSNEINDPRCLGAFLGAVEPDQPHSPANPYQVMAIGNGEMWVVDTGHNVRPGDYLISSGLGGHAMLDDENVYPVGNIVARAAESIAWSDVADTLEGRKHARISVFFENFRRIGSAQACSQHPGPRDGDSHIACAHPGDCASAKPLRLAAGLAPALLAVVCLSLLCVRREKAGAR